MIEDLLLEGLVIDNVQSRCTRLRKNLGVAAKRLSQGPGQSFMLTLTYARAYAWTKDHIKDCMRHLRQYFKRVHKWKLRYLWVMEIKNRLSGIDIGMAAPHYHAVVWLPDSITEADLHLDTLGWWPHGMTNAIRAVAPVKYIMKYVSKFDGVASFPLNARCYGIGGLEKDGRQCLRWLNWPSFVQARASVADLWKRRVGGGWVDLATGEHLCSEWRLSGFSKRFTRLIRVCTHDRPMAPVGPFNWLPT